MWYEKRGWSVLFLPLTWLFQLLALCRRRWQQRSAQKFSVPVIVVGNIAVGGTGKTPLVIAIVQSLQQQGWRPAVISRGYGSAAPRYPFAVTATTPPGQSGDEPLLIAQRTGVPVMIGADRVASVQALLAGNYNEKIDIVISDDGLQHYRLWRDIEIVAIDGSRGIGNGRCLPAGPLRESAKRLTQVDWVIVNSDAPDSQLNALFDRLSVSRHVAMQVQPSAWVNLHDGKRKNVESDFGGEKVHAVAGIGNPQRFFYSLARLGVDIIPHEFPDHHRFCAADIQFDDGRTVVMTEKDAVKCRPLLNALPTPKRYWYLEIEGALAPDFFAELNRHSRQVVST